MYRICPKGGDFPHIIVNALRFLKTINTIIIKDFSFDHLTLKPVFIRHLAKERQRIMDARNRLKEKNETFHSLPSPIGKATQRTWGHKYSIYTPITRYIDLYKGSQLPKYDYGYYTLNPRRKIEKSYPFYEFYNPYRRIFYHDNQFSQPYSKKMYPRKKKDLSHFEQKYKINPLYKPF